MNVTTIGFPFPGAAGAPAPGTPEQAFALALRAASLGLPVTAATANDGIANPANDPAPATRTKGQVVVQTQPAPSMTLAQLVAAGSKVPATVKAIAPGDIGADAEAQPGQPAADAVPTLPADAVAQGAAAPTPATAAPATPLPVKAAPAVAPTADAPAPADPKAASADPAAPDPSAKGQTVATGPVACPGAEGEAPGLAELPTAQRPDEKIVATPTVATPVKARKPLVIDRDTKPLPVDPLGAQPVAMVPVAMAPTAPTAAVAAPAERKADGGRGAKTVSATLGQPEAPANDGTALPDPRLGEVAGEARSGDASLSDAALPKEMGAKIESRAVASPQSFAAHVTQQTAPAAHAAAAPASPASAETVVPGRAGQIGHALGVEIARKVDSGEDTLRVRLNPVELGRVEVTLAFDDRGNLRATMRAESQHALELLRHDAPDLGRALDSAGIRSDSQSFRFESRGDGNGGATGGQGGQHQSRGNGQHAFNDEPETSAQAYRAIRNDGQVDLLA